MQPFLSGITKWVAAARSREPPSKSGAKTLVSLGNASEIRIEVSARALTLSFPFGYLSLASSARPMLSNSAPCFCAPSFAVRVTATVGAAPAKPEPKSGGNFDQTRAAGAPGA